jgi:predicted dehydrogenase
VVPAQPGRQEAPPDRSGLRIGIVGAGRTRNGLGPFLASAFAAAGASVVGVAGRDLASAGRAAAELTTRLGCPVAAFPSALALASAVDALVVASPVDAHQDGLRAALAAGIPCLCEKPLVAAADTAAGLEIVAEFAQRGLPIDENCQWPFVLPALWELHPRLHGRPVRRVSMGLGPSAAGRAMVVDSLSHVLSVVQALAAVDGDAGATDVQQSDPRPTAERNVLSFLLTAATGPVAVELHLQRCPEQPRPAWLEVNGCRMDRRIGAGYSQSFVAGERSVVAPDPLARLVYRFAALLGTRDLERTRELAAVLAVRLRCTASILAALDR